MRLAVLIPYLAPSHRRVAVKALTLMEAWAQQELRAALAAAARLAILEERAIPHLPRRRKAAMVEVGLHRQTLALVAAAAHRLLVQTQAQMPVQMGVQVRPLRFLVAASHTLAVVAAEAILTQRLELAAQVVAAMAAHRQMLRVAREPQIQVAVVAAVVTIL